MKACDALSAIHFDPEALFGLVLAFVGILLILRLHRGKGPFSFDYVLIDETTNRPSLFKLGALVALVATTWGFFVLTTKGTLTEWYFGAYMAAWAGARVLETYTRAKFTPGTAPAPDAKPAQSDVGAQ